MKILLVNPPNIKHDKTYLAPPIGILTLASFIRKFGFDVNILDLNLEMSENESLDNARFYDFAVNTILEKNPDVVGFTSMCLESHVSLEIAKRLKKLNLNIKNIFGGTHFGAISEELLENFNFVDFVITGEGENALLAILNYLQSAKIALPENVTYHESGKLRKGILENTIFSMDEIPFPAYDLVDLNRYFRLNPARLFNYEAGRGCVFKCSFCYSPTHYGNNVRHKTPELVVEELKMLTDLGAGHIFFVQDNFLNSPRWATAVCKQISDAKIPLTFECYTTYPQLKKQMIDSLADANCIGIFTGIDAVSISSQQRMNKPFLKSWETTSEKLAYCLEKGIKPLCAFILEEPDQDVEKIESVIHTALACIKLGCEVHLNTLTIYNKTELAKNLSVFKYNYSEIKPELNFDTPKVVQKNHFAKKLPQLFPIHATQNSIEDWELFIVKTYLVSSLVIGLTDTFYQYVVNEGKSIWNDLNSINFSHVRWLRNLKPSERRKAIILEFAKSFTEKDLSPKTKNSLYRELARVYLSNLKTKRIINLYINGIKHKADLVWFANLNIFSNFADVKDAKNQTVAFLNDEKRIGFYSVPFKLWKTLEELETASKIGKTLSLNQVEKNLLLKNKWISLVKRTNRNLPIESN